MKVVLISCFGFYQQRLQFIKKEFEENGHDVSVLFSDFDHINKRVRTNRIDGIEYIPSKPYKKNLSIARIYSHYRFSKMVYKRICEEDFDIIYAIIPPNTLCELLSNYKKKHKVKLIYDVYDLWPESFVYKNISKIIYPFLVYWKNLRNNQLNIADCVITECNLYHEVLNPYVDTNKLFTLYLTSSHIKNAIEKHLGEEIHICYLGSINHIINISLICTLLKAINEHKKVVLEIIGKGESKDTFIKTLERWKICYIDHGALYGKEKERVMEHCHFGINMMLDTVKVGLTMKSIDYFENSLPILNNIKGDTWDLVEDQGIGFNITEQNLNEVAGIVASLDDENYQKYLLKTKFIFDTKFSPKSFHQNFKEILELCENKSNN